MNKYIIFLGAAVLTIGIIFFSIIGSNPLMYFVSTKSYKLTSLAIFLGANPNNCEGGNNCALHIAVASSDLKMIKLLKKHGADLNILNSYKENALNVNCIELQMLEYFITNGVNVNNGSDLRNASGFTPLHCAILNKNSEAVKYLLQNGADKSLTVSKFGAETNVTPLRLAELQNFSEGVSLLR